MNAPFQSDQVFMPQCVTSAERCAAIWASLFDWAVVMFWNIIVVFCFSHGAVLNRELLHCTRSDSIEFIVCVCMRILHLLLIRCGYFDRTQCLLAEQEPCPYCRVAYIAHCKKTSASDHVASRSRVDYATLHP